MQTIYQQSLWSRVTRKHTCNDSFHLVLILNLVQLTRCQFQHLDEKERLGLETPNEASCESTTHEFGIIS